MNLPQIIPFISTTLLFGVTTVIFSYLEEKRKKELKQREKTLKQEIYQGSILKAIQERIGYELDLEKVVDVLTGSLHNLVPYSTTSSLVIKDNTLVYKSILSEKVSSNFLEEVKKNMLKSFSLLITEPLPSQTHETIEGEVFDNSSNLYPASFFNMPLVVNDKVVGLINVSSIKPNLYKEDEMTILYKITDQASKALGKLLTILESEKKKIVAFEENLAQMKQDFVNITVHDLRAPLTAVKGAADILISSRDKLTVEEQNKMLEIIDGQLKKIINQVSSILDAAKMEAGKFALQKANGDLKKVVKEAAQIFSAQIKSKHITLTQNIDETIPEFEFDQDRVGRVINNLLSNSLKFTKDGGAITIKAFQAPDKITISVTDNGSGIPKDRQGDLFSKYNQVNTSQSSKGTGLGLYIVKGIVQAHGGTVSLESEVDHGTTITFTLPISPITHISPTPPQSPLPSEALAKGGPLPPIAPTNFPATPPLPPSQPPSYFPPLSA